MPNDKADAQTIQRKYDGKPQGLAKYLAIICLAKTNVVKELFFLLNNFSTLDVGYRFVHIIPPAILIKLVNMREGKAFSELLLSWLKAVKPENNSPAVAPDVDSVIALMKLKTAIDNASLPQEEPNSGSNITIPFATLKEGENIRLSPFVIEKLTLIAAVYHKETGKTLTITDGNRTALEQAYQMIKQIRIGEIGLYTQKAAAAEVKQVYDSGRSAKKSDTEIAEDVRKVIQNQMDKKGIYISRHLKNRGADIRSRDMSANELKAFKQAVIKNGVEVLKEGNHLHLQF